jgi:hypothetical protein
MQVALSVRAAVDDGLDVIAGPGIAGAKRAAAAAGGIAPLAEALEHPEPHARRTGAKALAKAIRRSFGRHTPIQRCQIHYAALRIMPTSAAKPAWEAQIAVKDAA